MEKANYYLMIHTNACVRDFDMELIAYVFGTLNKAQEEMGCAKEYKRVFWNNVTGMQVDSMREYKSYIDIISLFQNEKLKEILDIYKYLQYTHKGSGVKDQVVFYDTGLFYGNEESAHDTILVQLKEPLREDLETFVVERIKNFFQMNVFGIVEDYSWLCEFGERREKGKEDSAMLLDLELMDSNKNLIKKYV